MTSDHIVVFAIDDEPVRPMRLVVALSRRGFTVIANETAGGVTEVYDFMYDAAAVVAISGCGSTAGWPWIGAEIGRIVPVVFTSAARMPNQLAQLEPIDLTDWGEGGSGFEELVRRLAALVEDARQRPSLFNPLLPGPVGVSPEASDVSSPLYSIGELRRLTSGVRDIAELLADDAYHTRQVRATLDEIGASYRVVLDTIDEFYASGSDPDHFDVAALARIRGGRLAERIHNGRGHCKRIGARYFAYGGLRDAIRTRAHAGTLEKADATFGQLTNADMDLFDALDDVGKALTQQARETYSLVRGGQPQEAQRRFQHALNVLAPLEDALQGALHDFLNVEQLLGYAQDSPAEVPHVEDRSVHVYGDVTNSVVASTIKNSGVTLQSAQLPIELKRDMEQLLVAVTAMSERLSAEDAEAAALEVDQLTRELASDQPKKGVIKKCLRSIEEFGRRVADVGLPVVELAAKIAAFF